MKIMIRKTYRVTIDFSLDFPTDAEDEPILPLSTRECRSLVVGAERGIKQVCDLFYKQFYYENNEIIELKKVK